MEKELNNKESSKESLECIQALNIKLPGEFLPAGSVVLLKKAQKRLMVAGRLQRDLESSEIFDYAGCLWPEGVISSDRFYLFNNEDIDTVYFLGYQDGEEEAFQQMLCEQKPNLKKDLPF